MLHKYFLILLCALMLAACGNDHPQAQDTPTGAATGPATTPAVAATTPLAGQDTPTITTSAAASTPTAPESSMTAVADTVSGNAAPAPVTAPAETGKWIAGKNYFVLQPQQPRLNEAGRNSVEIVEVFSYGCPACSHAQPYMRKLARSLPAGAIMEYLPVSFRPDENFPLYQRAFYTAQVFGVAKKAHDAMFDATWKTGETASYDLASNRPKPRPDWPGIKDMAKFYANYGVDPQQFASTAQSFAINMKMKRADQMVKSWQVHSTPSIVINGKYRFTARSAGGYSQLIELTQWLVQKERHAMQQEH